MPFQVFLDSVENVPPELKRNFTLMTDLDNRTKDIMARIESCLVRYKASTKRSERATIKKESDDLFERLNGLGDDKIDLALQTYEMIDKCIKRLILIPQSKQNDNGSTALLGYDMPLDPNEPKYCLCRGVSHGDMVACDNKECPIEWFHYACVGLLAAPKGKWYCSDCLGNIVKKRRKSIRSRRR